MKAMLAAALLAAALAHTAAPRALAQAGSHTIFGDVKVDDSKVEGMVPQTFDIILYRLGGTVVQRQRVTNNGRYRFMGVRSGEYQIAVESESQEIARLHISLGGVSGVGNSETRQDIELEWKPGAFGGPPKKATISAADFYKREGASKAAFERAQGEMNKKKYAEAAAALAQLTASDPQDFQAWTELGTAYLLQDKKGDAEKAYQRALEVRPTFSLALLNLGRLRAADKRFEEAVEPLTRAAEALPENAEVHFLLGETYLQLRKGSKAVPHLNVAARLGRGEAHLRLAALYNAAGRKDLAAAEYEQLLTKQPEHPDRKKFQEYIKENKKP